MDRNQVGDDTVAKSGTTTVALATAEGVVIAADRRASLGGRFVSNKSAVKVEQVHPTAALTLSGSVGEGQAVLRQVRARADLYESRRGRPMSIPALVRAVGDVVRGRAVAPLLGGVDPARTGGDGDEPHVYSVDGAGGVLEDDYVASGSGTTLAIGALERSYREDLSFSEGIEIAIDAVDSAIERDTASGNGVTVARIDADGVSIDSYDALPEVEP
jgi:proteasome beta subunit